MIDLISKKLIASGAEFAEISVEGDTYIIFALPYVQLERPPEGYAFIDSYYVASNRAYFLRKELCAELEKEGFETFTCEHSYKHIAVAAGLGIRLKSTLVANEKFGTRIALEIIGIRGVFAREITKAELYKKPELQEKCVSCKICESLCPQSCISQTGIDPDRCTRRAQENCFFADEKSAAAAGEHLWGCDVCQRCCPFNKAQPERKMTERERELFKLENLFNAFSSGKKGCEPYRDILGGNYLRPSRLLALTLNVMANEKNPQKYLSLAKSAENHPDERVKKAVKNLIIKC